MTTVTAATTRSQLGEAAGAAQQIRQRYKTIAAGSTEQTVRDDMIALAVTLEAAATQYATAGGPQSSAAHTLSWSTGGSNDATTKATALAWLYGHPGPPGCGAYYPNTGTLVPKLGAALTTLIGGL